MRSFDTSVNEIELSTTGLDEIQIINSESNSIEVSVFDENPNSHYIIVDEENDLLKIEFNLQFINDESTVFRKFITERLNRASAVVKIPKNKSIIIYGTNIDLISKNYEGDLKIYIDKGLLKLNKVEGNIEAKLFQGNVFAEVKNSNIEVVSNNGKIMVNEEIHSKKYKKSSKFTSKIFKITSINANVMLTTK
ncbi:hypothetical protein C7447_101642 [Tenacibaculum adriaticum]|uniref:Adhesin domain-containing protein n=1 Tax=Tenacibaculum adriaticum TaxID=413713 RepID=A0A5S5DVT6_9FLAO|nr:hypothetical protein [Tenacibaculum adriaticum]TYQ00034.1 hypothetical protein C7447_101642 [Tenacibaculum adriaticum]